MQILSNPISALNVRESPKFSRCLGNRNRGTRWRRQISDRKWKYGRFVHAQPFGHNYRNSSFIVDVAMEQTPRSTERISSLGMKTAQNHVIDKSDTLLAKTSYSFRLVSFQFPDTRAYS